MLYASIPFVGVKYGIIQRKSCPTDFSKMEATNIKSLSECNEAAKYLKLSDTTAEHDGKKQYNNDAPPGCYFDGGKLKFNNDLDDSGNVINTGLCTKKQWCLCNGIGMWRTLLLFLRVWSPFCCGKNDTRGPP